MQKSENSEVAPPLSLPLLERQSGTSVASPERTNSLPLHLPTKRRGEIAEAAFLHKAASLGFSVAKPWGDSDRYDFIVETGGRFWRVQVKTASRVGEGAYSIHACGSVPSRVYTAAEIDFLVAYIVSENLWYVLPVHIFTKVRHVKFHPFRKKPLSLRNLSRSLALPAQLGSCGMHTAEVKFVLEGHVIPSEAKQARVGRAPRPPNACERCAPW